MNLTNRQKEIFSAILQEYSKKGKPVSSKLLIKKHGFFYSPATLRGEMHLLEKQGFLKKPHTSAGRMPTEKGYRFYIKKLMEKKDLEKQEKIKIKVKVNQAKQENDFPQELAEVLASFSESLALVGRFHEKHFHFAGLEELLEEMGQDMFQDVAHFIQELERDFENFFDKEMKEPGVFIGQDHPLLRNTKCGLILSPYKRGKDKGILALLGPSRMNYERNLALLDYINRILD